MVQVENPLSFNLPMQQIVQWLEANKLKEKDKLKEAREKAFPKQIKKLLAQSQDTGIDWLMAQMREVMSEDSDALDDEKFREKLINAFMSLKRNKRELTELTNAYMRHLKVETTLDQFTVQVPKQTVEDD